MNLAQIRAFHAVATHRGFSAAAQALGVSQPAVTQQIKAIEDALGARLFDRRGGTVELTLAGRNLLPQVHHAAMILDDLDARINNARGLRVGNLSIGICAPYIVMPILKRFMAGYPGIRLDVRLENSNELLDLVAKHNIDLSISTLTEPNPDFACVPLIAQHVLVLVPPNHEWAERQTIDVSELSGAPFILRETGSMTRSLFEQGLMRAGVEVDVRLVLGSRETVKEAVAAGLGCGIVLDRELGVSPGIRGIPVTGATMSAAEYIVTLPEIAPLGGVSAFIAAARAVYGQTESPGGAPVT
ncbi:MAG TPA: LysR substrate-binding domain-containing protein [Devosiaceae bacterium]|nr:LysR substrate-binding domain-containing protein [Devosiaceae bacterium]